jgi:putative inorganic carbon (HCO3(-)) transporter
MTGYCETWTRAEACKPMSPTIGVPRNLFTLQRAITAQTRQIGLIGVVIALGILLAWLPLSLTAAVLIATMGAILILLRPVWGLVALILLIPFSSLASVQVGGVSVGGMEALLAMILVAWLVRMAARRQIVVPHPPLLLPWLIWLGAILTSWMVALSLGDALAETIKWVEMLALYLFVVANVERRHLPWLIGAVLLAGTAQAILGLYQFLFRAGPAGFLLFGGQFLRAYGTFRQPNPYAGYLGLVLPLAYSLALWRLEGQPPASAPHASHRPRYPLLITVSSLLSFGLMLAALFASQSRGAWIGFAAALVAVSLVRGGRTTLVFTLLIALLATAGALGGFQGIAPTITQRFGDVLAGLSVPDIATAEVTDTNFASIERLAHWEAATHMWRDHPWLGVGFGNYAATYPAYAIGRWLDPLGHAHDFYLNVGAETGLVGLLAYVLFWLSAFVLSWRAVRRSSGFQRAIAAGGLGILVHLSVHNVVDNLFVQGMYLHMAIVLGLVCIIFQAEMGRSHLLGGSGALHLAKRNAPQNWEASTKIDNSGWRG